MTLWNVMWPRRASLGKYGSVHAVSEVSLGCSLGHPGPITLSFSSPFTGYLPVIRHFIFMVLIKFYWYWAREQVFIVRTAAQSSCGLIFIHIYYFECPGYIYTSSGVTTCYSYITHNFPVLFSKDFNNYTTFFGCFRTCSRCCVVLQGYFLSCPRSHCGISTK